MHDQYQGDERDAYGCFYCRQGCGLVFSTRSIRNRYININGNVRILTTSIGARYVLYNAIENADNQRLQKLLHIMQYFLQPSCILLRVVITGFTLDRLVGQ